MAAPQVAVAPVAGGRKPGQPDADAIPFGRPMFGDEERAAVAEVLAGTILTHGPGVERFEQAFAGFTGAEHAVAVASCTAGLHLAYLYIGVRPGEEVIVPAQTHVASAHAVELCGARPVFVDCDEVGNLDLDRAAAAIGPRTRAICVVHFLGRPVDMKRVTALAARHGLFVVEDCALALGAHCDGRHVGLHGDVGCFSFYPVKHITTGEGGMLITRRADVATAAARQRAFGIDRNVPGRRPLPGDYDVELLGHNYRMPEMAAALGIEQLRRLPGFLAARAANHEALARALAGIEGVRVLARPDDAESCAWYCLGLMLEEPLAARRPAVLEHLRSRGVGFSVYYPRPLPLMSYFQARYGSRVDEFAVADGISRRSIALPVGPHVVRADIDRMARAVREAIHLVSRP